VILFLSAAEKGTGGQNKANMRRAIIELAEAWFFLLQGESLRTSEAESECFHRFHHPGPD
jgi:hypothetical protein